MARKFLNRRSCALSTGRQPRSADVRHIVAKRYPSASQDWILSRADRDSDQARRPALTNFVHVVARAEISLTAMVGRRCSTKRNCVPQWLRGESPFPSAATCILSTVLAVPPAFSHFCYVNRSRSVCSRTNLAPWQVYANKL